MWRIERTEDEGPQSVEEARSHPRMSSREDEKIIRRKIRIIEMWNKLLIELSLMLSPIHFRIVFVYTNFRCLNFGLAQIKNYINALFKLLPPRKV